MQRLRIFGDVTTQAGLIIVAAVNHERIHELLNADKVALRNLIMKQDQPEAVAAPVAG